MYLTAFVALKEKRDEAKKEKDAAEKIFSNMNAIHVIY